MKHKSCIEKTNNSTYRYENVLEKDKKFINRVLKLQEGNLNNLDDSVWHFLLKAKGFLLISLRRVCQSEFQRE